MKSQWTMPGLLAAVLCSGCGGSASGPSYYNPDLSPDGTRVVFESNRDGKFAIYVVGIDGSGLRRLTSAQVNDEQPRWSPDGRRIVFFSGRDGRGQLYTMDDSGGSQRRLTTSDRADFRADFAPSGQLIVFMTSPTGIGKSHDIDIVRADGTGRKRLTDGSADFMGPRWSPDGSKIVYVRGQGRNANAEIYVMAADGSAPVALTHNSVRDYRPTWSADGTTIYFLSEREKPTAVYAMSADGSQTRKIADASIVAGTSISRDGKFFVYDKVVGGKSGIYLFEIATGLEQRVIGADSEVVRKRHATARTGRRR